jgi:hypothetical protein
MSFHNFPNIYCASLKESTERQENIRKQFLENNVQSFQFLLSERFENTNDIIEGEKTFYLDHGTKGAITSHLRMIKHWYYNTNESYGFFCEDDLSFETIQYWNFTWDEFIESLPKDWDCIQLICASENSDDIRLRRRTWDDFSVGAYIVTRKFAKVLIDTFIKEDKFLLEFPNNNDWVPLAEHLIYYSPKSVVDSQNLEYNVYVLPLFVEEIKFTTTFFDRKSKYWGEDTGLYKETHKGHHIDSYHKVLNWWENIGKNLSLNEILNK